MEIIYELWDREEAYPIIEYLELSDALAFVAATVRNGGEEAVKEWTLLRSTPASDWSETIAQGKELARLARENTHAMPA